jgi:hypothetical protein
VSHTRKAIYNFESFEIDIQSKKYKYCKSILYFKALFRFCQGPLMFLRGAYTLWCKDGVALVSKARIFPWETVGSDLS